MSETSSWGDQLYPRDVIVPVFGAADDHRAVRFLGTGSIIGDGSILLTADHVTRDWRGNLAIKVMRDLTRTYPINAIERDPAHDLALFRVDEYRPGRPLKVSFDGDVQENYSLMTYEYGTTVVAGSKIGLNPAVRVGHMTRRITLPANFGAVGEAMELSFPALRGASGAPVMLNEFVTDALMGKDPFGVVGVVLASASYHLLPVQIESVLTEDDTLYEEVRYMLPQAVAISIDHLRPMYERAMS